MGSGISNNKKFEHITPLQCPENYDPEKFRQICKLFDILDDSGNLSLELPELKEISTLHVSNKIRKLNSKKQYHKSVFEDLSKKILLNYEKNKKSLEDDYNNKMINLNKDIETLENFSEDDCCMFFYQNVTSGGEFTFQRFFDYVKNKTDDFVNIPGINIK